MSAKADATERLFTPVIGTLNLKVSFSIENLIHAKVSIFPSRIAE
ncbi:hypothetical protein [Reinekea sp. G2M2-21]|nr:hypothetical protein [Reinekea sp. G2M2-21]